MSSHYDKATEIVAAVRENLRWTFAGQFPLQWDQYRKGPKVVQGRGGKDNLD